MDKKEKYFDKILSTLPHIANISQISGVALIPLIVSIINIKNIVLSIIIGAVSIVLIIICIICIFLLRKQISRLKIDINNKEKELTMKDTQLNMLRERITTFKYVFKKQKYTSAGHYLLYKDTYDDFKTALWLLKCDLDVEILEMNDKTKKGNLQFIWTLEVINSSSNPINTAHFIYSGDKNKKIDPDIKVTIGGKDRKVKPININKGVPGDDRFTLFKLGTELLNNQKATIEINYIINKYNFKKGFRRIWLVPDALGFSGMDSFCIRFYSNEKNKYKHKTAVLTSYSLKGEYDWKTVINSPFQKLDNDKNGFEAKSEEGFLLHDCGYVFILPKID